MLDRILYFLFRKNTGLSLMAVLVTAIAFTMSGCTCDCGLLKCNCDENGGCGAEPGCICAPIGACNEKCDQSCGACHSCNQCLDNCVNGCAGGCIDGCVDGCNDGCDDCQNGCQESRYEYSLDLTVGLRDTQGQNLQEEYRTNSFKIWSAELTRKQAASKKNTFTIELTQQIKNQIFGSTSLESYYKVAGITAASRRGATGDNDLDDSPFEYTIEYSSANGTITISTPDWTDNHQTYYNMYAIVAVEEIDYGKSVDVVVKYPENTGIPEERYYTKVGQPLPEIEIKDIVGYTCNSAYVTKDGKKFIFDSSKNFHKYDFDNSSIQQAQGYTLKFNSQNNGYVLTYDLRYSLNSYDFAGVKTVNGEEIKTCRLTVKHGESLNESLGKFKTAYGSEFNESDFYSAIWTLDKEGQIPYEYSPSNDKITGNVTLYFHATTAITVTLHNIKGEESDSRTLRFPYGAYVGGLDYPIYDLNDYGRFRFIGWYTNAELTERFDPSERFESFYLYAKWSEETTYAVRYFATLDALAAQSPSYNGEYDRKLGLTLPTSDTLDQLGVLPPDSDRYTYVFAGWQIANGDNGTITLSAPTGRLEEENYNADVDLVAAFTHKIRLIINSSTESLNGNPSDYSAYYGQPFDLPVPTSTDNLKFKGWRTDDGTLVSDDKGHIDRFKPSSAMPAPVDTSYLVPVWETGSATITFKWTENGETKTAEKIGKIGEALPDVPTAPAFKGHDFVGWFDDGGNEFDKTAPLTTNATYTAKYEAKTFTITLIVKSADGNETTFGQVTVRYGEKADLGVPTAEGQTFIFWQDAAENIWSGSDGKMTKDYDLESDVTLYAFMM